MSVKDELHLTEAVRKRAFLSGLEKLKLMFNSHCEDDDDEDDNSQLTQHLYSRCERCEGQQPCFHLEQVRNDHDGGFVTSRGNWLYEQDYVVKVNAKHICYSYLRSIEYELAKVLHSAISLFASKYRGRRAKVMILHEGLASEIIIKPHRREVVFFVALATIRVTSGNFIFPDGKLTVYTCCEPCFPYCPKYQHLFSKLNADV